MVPDGRRIEKTHPWDAGGDLTIRLLHGLHANNKQDSYPDLPAVRVPEHLRSLHPAVAELKDDPNRLIMPAALRRRSLLILQALASEATSRGHIVQPVEVPQHARHHPYGSPRRSYSLRSGEISLVIAGHRYQVTIQQESPHSADPEKLQRLVLELPYCPGDRQRRWADRKTRVVEDSLARLLAEAEALASDDTRRAIEAAKAKADRQVRWEEAMGLAQERALEAHYAKMLEQQTVRWDRARNLRAYCRALEQRLGDAEPSTRPANSAWLAWAEQYVETIDPLRDLPEMPEAPTFKPEDLKPFLGRWSPYGPERSSSGWGAANC